MINGSQSIVARYLYYPSGQIEGKWGPQANANEMQFSSMPFHNLYGLSLYPNRAYSPNLQRWLNRDPIGEAGGINMYRFAGNNPIHYVDPYGLAIGDNWDPRTWLNSGFTGAWSGESTSIVKGSVNDIVILFTMLGILWMKGQSEKNDKAPFC